MAIRLCKRFKTSILLFTSHQSSLQDLLPKQSTVSQRRRQSKHNGGAQTQSEGALKQMKFY